MDPIAIAALLITGIACCWGIVLLIYWPIRWTIRRYSAEREYQAMLRAHSIYHKRPKDRVL